MTDEYCIIYVTISLRVISEQTPAAFRRTPKGRRQAESRHSCKAYLRIASHPQNERDSRTLQKNHLPKHKNFPREHPLKTKRIKSLPCKGGCAWGKFSVREGGLEGEGTPSERGSLLPPRSSHAFLKISFAEEVPMKRQLPLILPSSFALS